MPAHGCPAQKAVPHPVRRLAVSPPPTIYNGIFRVPSFTSRPVLPAFCGMNLGFNIRCRTGIFLIVRRNKYSIIYIVCVIPKLYVFMQIRHFNVCGQNRRSFLFLQICLSAFSAAFGLIIYFTETAITKQGETEDNRAVFRNSKPRKKRSSRHVSTNMYYKTTFLHNLLTKQCLCAIISVDLNRSKE